MAKTEKQEFNPELEAQQKEEFMRIFKSMNVTEMKKIAETIRMFQRALNGRPIEDKDMITRLINLSHVWERTRLPTYPMVAKQVYGRLIATYHPECKAFEKWMDYDAEAMISYKGENWKAYVEMTKAIANVQESGVYVGQFGQPEQPKKHFWQRTPKPAKEESEFQNQ